MSALLFRELKIALTALQFLTRIPAPAFVGHSAEQLNAASRHFPTIGVLVGAIGAAVFLAADVVFPQTLAVLIATAATILATGAFHEDGFADACDGLGGGHTRERALLIMKDSRLGTYGALGLALMVGAKIAALAAMPAALVPVALIAAHAASRASSVVVIATSAYAREDGTAKPLATTVSARGLILALAVGLAPSLLLGWAAVPALLGLALGHALMRLSFEKKLGGYTGDCLGGVQQTSELGFYLAALAWLSF